MRGRHALTTALVGAAALALPSVAAAFGTVSILGQAREHEMITRAALSCPPGTPSNGTCFEPVTQNSLAGTAGTFGGVGAPDIPPPESADAHCDEGDFLNARLYPRVASYPRSRRQATTELNKCRKKLKSRFNQGIAAAPRLLDANDRIIPAEVDLSTTCTFAGSLSGRAKCDVFDGFGRALHGVQDFYSHTNWSDRPVPPARVDDRNPPGLGRRTVAPFLDLRRAGNVRIPALLISGCFSLNEVNLSPVDGCKAGVPGFRVDRVRHVDLNKDKGTINPLTGAATAPKTPRGRVGSNFANAVRLAQADTRRQWSDFRAELVRKYGAKRGNLMICALTRDDPVKTCQQRKVAIVIDSSGSNRRTDPEDRRVAAAQQFNASLTSDAEAGPDGGADRSAVIDFDSSARIVSPLRDPDGASFAGIDSAGGTNIASGVNLAIDELVREESESVAGRSGIVVFTDGQDSDRTDLITAIGRAAASGIRVSIGFLAAPENPAGQSLNATVRPPNDVVEALIASGGFYSTIDSPEDQDAFVEAVVANGVTGLDDPNGSDDGGFVQPGAATTGSISDPRDADTYELAGVRGRVLRIEADGLRGQSMRVEVRDVAAARRVAAGRDTLTVRPRGSGPLQLVVRSSSPGAYSLDVDEEGVDLVGTRRRDTLRCGDAPTYVNARAGNDTVTCGAGDDLIEGGPGRDTLRGSGGDDIFVIRARQRHRGIERINGGPGMDTVEFDLPLARGGRCRANAVNVFRLGAARYSLRNVERITFRGRRCL